MKKVLFGIVVAFALVGLGVVGNEIYRTYRYAQAAATYLFSETEIKDKQGRSLSRADLIDEILRDAVKRAASAQPKQNQ